MITMNAIIGITIIILMFLFVGYMQFWFFRKYSKEYKKINDPKYVKDAYTNLKILGKPVTQKRILMMIIILTIICGLLWAGAIYVFFKQGFNQLCGGLFAFGLIFAYAAYDWGHYEKRRPVLNEENIKKLSNYNKAFIIILLVLALPMNLFPKNIFVSSPIFQILIISLAVIFIITKEIVIRKTMRK
jgi:hypothetical protein